MKKLNPIELKEVFIQLQQEDIDLVLVGGQAINFWATLYRDREPKLEQYLPFSSEDIDFFGGRIEAAICHQILGGDLKLNRDFNPSPNSGVIVTNFQNNKLRIDFLYSVFGLNDTEISESAIIFVGKEELAGIELKVLNPILCLEGKLKSVVGLPQQGRQDLKHLQISLLCAREFTKNICTNKSSRTGLKLVERITKNAMTEAGLQVWHQHQIFIESAIPLDIIADLKDEKWVNFNQIRLSQILEQIETKRQRYQQAISQ
ncbi:MAG: hypothetical protein AB4426_24895 [Xenococcaceae cyanobacterium]